MFVLKFSYADPDETEPQEEEFDLLDEAHRRACALLHTAKAVDFSIEDQDGAQLRDDQQIRNWCAAHYKASAYSSGGSGGSGRRRIKITAAVFNERGQQFAIVRVADHALNNQTLNQMRDLFRMPVVLLGSRRTFGDPNLVRWMQNIDPRRITGWREYTFTL